MDPDKTNRETLKEDDLRLPHLASHILTRRKNESIYAKIIKSEQSKEYKADW